MLVWMLSLFVGASLLRNVTWCKYTLHSLSPLSSVRWSATFTGATRFSGTRSHHRIKRRPLGRLPSILIVTINRSMYFRPRSREQMLYT